MCFYYFPEKKKTQPYILTPQTYQEYWFFWIPCPLPLIDSAFYHHLIFIRTSTIHVFIDMDKYCFFYVCQFEYYL